MGQTLNHGVYLPAEGERNCYSGLASNWNLLDTAIGDIAGKASATHTHGNITNDGKVGTTANLPLITGTSGAVQAGAFGNQANTFCEGNDSRLSDARTPVAHTHTKSDVTDLFNSANTWSGDNTFTKYQSIVHNGAEIGVAPTSQNSNGLLFKDKNKVNIGWLRQQYDTSGNLSIEMLVSNKYKNGALDPTGTQVYQGVKQTITSNGVSYFSWSGYVNNSLYPYTTETFNIGDSTHQWNNLYAKNYYYNGVAWGLDKSNTWTNAQIYSTYGYGQQIWLKNTGLDFSVNGNTGLTETYQHLINWADKNNTSYSTIQSWTNNTENVLVLRSRYRTDANTVRISSIRNQCTNNAKRWYPESDADTDLGTTSNRWKTLNGVNPGALSLPNLSINTATGNNPPNGYVDIDTTNWDLTGSNPISYTPPVDGWISIRGKDEVGNFIFATQICIRQSVLATGASSALASGLSLVMPVNKNVAVTIYCKVPQTSLIAYFTPCQGNV